MHKYEHVEDYLEVIAGLRDPVTLKPVGLGWFSPIINLARYDIPVLNSMSEHTYSGGSLTERQGELAVKLIVKYHRQLSSHGIDSNIINRTKFRNPFRVIDEKKEIDLSGDQIEIKFPYNKDMIEEIKKFAEHSQGRCAWYRDDKVWRAALTEYNLSWLIAWGNKNKFEIGQFLRDLFKELQQVETTKFSITLTQKNGQLVFENVADSLLSYVNGHIGEVCKQNLLALIDHSSMLCYQVDPLVYDLLEVDIPDAVKRLMTERQLIDPHTDPISTMLTAKQYAESLDQFPIFVYEPDLSNTLLTAARQCFNEDEIQTVGIKRTKSIGINPKIRVVHCLKPITHIDIPLLISSAGLIAGGERQMMLQRSRKVVYLSPAVYNNKNKTAIPHL